MMDQATGVMTLEYDTTVASQRSVPANSMAKADFRLPYLPERLTVAWGGRRQTVVPAEHLKNPKSGWIYITLESSGGLYLWQRD
jgi:hypothetical protein